MKIQYSALAIRNANTISKSINNIDSTTRRLASGERINSAADDAAGLSLSSKLTAEIRSRNQGVRNANDGISMIQVAEGALGEISAMLIRIRELAIQAASDTIGAEERGYLHRESQQLYSEIDRITQSTAFNDRKLLSGGGIWPRLEIQTGTGNDPRVDRTEINRISLDSSVENLGMAGISLATAEDARSSLQDIDFALNRVSKQRAEAASIQAGLATNVSNMMNQTVNESATRSRIQDADYAAETAEKIKASIMLETNVALRQQMNSESVTALKLLESV